MEDPSTDTKPTPSHGRHSKKREPRPSKPLNRTSALGDSINSGGFSSTNSRARDKEVMAASFLQYCAMCEKQIMTPSNSLLYCSEACRRKDSAKPLSATLLASPPRPMSASVPSSPRPMLHKPSSSVMMAYHNSAPVVVRIPPDMHGHKSDLDPTEWKPKLGDSHRKTSEAFRYLSQFHQIMNNNTTITTATDMNNPDTTTIITPSDTPSDTPSETNGDLTTVQYSSSGSHATKRPRSTMHRSTMSMTTISTPSLSSLNNTPTTGPSSFDSNTPGYGYRHDYEYDFNLRPLPPRQNPLYYSTSAGAGKGIDLVTPHVAPPPRIVTDETVSSMPTCDHDFWGKKKVVAVATTSAGGAVQGGAPSINKHGDGLGALFGKAA